MFIKSQEASEAALAASDKAIAAHKAEIEASRENLNKMVEEAQAAEAALIAEIENAREALGTDEQQPKRAVLRLRGGAFARADCLPR